MLPKDYTNMAANQIKLFANFDKMRILEYLLINGATNVSDIVNGISTDQLKVSQYLKRMRDDGFVTAHRNGRFIYYEINNGIHRTAIECIRKRYNNLKNKEDF